MKARIIHLDRHVERKKRCESEIRRLKRLKPIWVDAVDAEKLSAASVGTFGVKTTYAIRQSHMKCWQQFIDEDRYEDHCLILEDDAVLESNFEATLFEKLSHLRSKKEPWDLLFCGHFEVPPDGGMAWLWQILSKVTPIGHQEFKSIEPGIVQPRFALGAHAYVISKKGAQKCLEFFEAQGNGLHVDLGFQLHPDLKFLAVVPPIATQAPSNDNSSFFKDRHGFPRFINTQLDRIKNPYGMSYAYMMTVPLGAVCGYEINGWLIIGLLLLLCAICTSYLLMGRVPWGWLLLCFCFIYIMDSVFYQYLIERSTSTQERSLRSTSK